MLKATNQSRSRRFVLRSMCWSSRCFRSRNNTCSLASWILGNTAHNQHLVNQSTVLTLFHPIPQTIKSQHWTNVTNETRSKW